MARTMTVGVILMAMLLLVMLPSVSAASAQSNPTVNVNYEIQLEQSYQLFGSITESMFVNVNGPVNPQGSPTLVTVAFPFDYTGVLGLPPGANKTLLGGEPESSYTTLTVHIPANATSFSFDVVGTLSGYSSLFFRDIASVPPIFVYTNLPYPMVFDVLVPDSSIQVRSVYPSGAAQYVSIGGQSYLQISPEASTISNPVSIVYQSPLSDYYAFVAIVILASLAFIIPFAAWKTRARIESLRKRTPGMLRSFFGKVFHRRGSKALLGALVFLCLAMISLSTIFGPPPQPRAYLAATNPTAQTIGPYVSEAGWSYLDAAQAADGFSRSSNLGTFSAAIIADYPPAILSASPFQSGLMYVPYVIVLKQNVSSSYLSQLESVRGNVIVLSSLSEIPSTLASIGGRTNAFGLSVSEGLYNRVTELVGLLSLLVPFFALAFLASVMIDVGEGGLTGAFEAIGYMLMVYLIADFAFIVTTVMLGTPVALHAAISNKESAEGLLGPFGGGTRPREVSGILGFLFGIVYNKKGALSFDRNVLIAIAAAIGFVILDPLNVASSIYDVLLIVSSNVGVGVSGPVASFLRNVVLGQSLTWFQSYITSGYVASHGAELFFLCALPFLLYPRIQKGTGTILMLFAALGCGLGFVRVADLVPMETIGSAAPGLLLGVAFLAVFWGASKVESIVRSRSPFR